MHDQSMAWTLMRLKVGPCYINRLIRKLNGLKIQKTSAVVERLGSRSTHYELIS